MQYIVTLIAAFIGLVLFGPFGAIAAILIWWLVGQYKRRNQK